MLRFLFPFGDEPDFLYRAENLIYSDYSIFSPYNLISQVFVDFELISQCSSSHGVFSVWAYTGGAGCVEPVWQILTRVLSVIFVSFPMFLILTFRRLSFGAVRIFSKFRDPRDWNQRSDTLSLTLLFPSVIFYLGVLAAEQLVLILSLLIFQFWRSSPIVIVLLVSVFSVDFGNGIVLLAFLVLVLVFNLIDRNLGFPGLFLAMAVMFSTCLVLGYSLLGYLDDITLIGQKAASINAKAISIGDEIRAKYPVILRPVITYMSGVFMTPAGVKVIPAYLLTFFGLVLVTIKVFKSFRFHKYTDGKSKYYVEFRSACVNALAAISTVISLVFLLPDYANAKYYVFLLPYIFFISSFVVPTTKLAYFNIVISAVVVTQLLLYKI